MVSNTSSAVINTARDAETVCSVFGFTYPIEVARTPKVPIKPALLHATRCGRDVVIVESIVSSRVLTEMFNSSIVGPRRFC